MSCGDPWNFDKSRIVGYGFYGGLFNPKTHSFNYKDIYLDKKAIEASKLDREEFYRYMIENMMNKNNELEKKEANPWIEWSKQAPTEKDLPIECANYGGSFFEFAFNLLDIPTIYGKPGLYDLWRPYVCDIPKSPKPDEVYYLIGHPGTGEPMFCPTFEMCMDKWFEGFNVPVKYLNDKKEPFAESKKRVEEYFKNPPKKSSDPQPDANGWWRIEDRKPEEKTDIQVKFKESGEVRYGYYSMEAIYLPLGVRTFYIGEFDMWCPLDMSGPVE